MNSKPLLLMVLLIGFTLPGVALADLRLAWLLTSVVTMRLRTESFAARLNGVTL
jgi:hypothetical protein